MDKVQNKEIEQMMDKVQNKESSNIIPLPKTFRDEFKRFCIH
jgi:hypothetical protein